MIIGFLNQKGGVGKTTLSIHIAMAFALKNMKSLLVDADPQSSALDWSASRVETGLFPIVGLPKATLHRELQPIAKDYDAVVIDAPPNASDIARSGILASDLIIIPVQPSPYDIWAAKGIVDLIHEAKGFKEDIKCAFAINRKIANTSIGTDAQEALEKYGIHIFKTAVHQRVSFAETAAIGMTVLESDASGKAAQEIIALSREIEELLK